MHMNMKKLKKKGKIQKIVQCQKKLLIEFSQVVNNLDLSEELVIKQPALPELKEDETMKEDSIIIIVTYNLSRRKLKKCKRQ